MSRKPRLPSAPLIGLCGYAGSGKDALAACLVERHGWRRVAFADPLKDVARRIGWDGAKDDRGRRLLQDLGVAVRDVIGPDTWVDLALADLTGPTVVTDCRFTNEIDAIRARRGIIVRVDRPGVGPVNDHVSEHEWTSVRPNRVVRNDGSLDDLGAWARRIDLQARIPHHADEPSA